jgi:hypothetical protein
LWFLFPPAWSPKTRNPTTPVAWGIPTHDTCTHHINNTHEIQGTSCEIELPVSLFLQRLHFLYKARRGWPFSHAAFLRSILGTRRPPAQDQPTTNTVGKASPD